MSSLNIFLLIISHLVIRLKLDESLHEGRDLLRELILREHLVGHALRQLAVAVRHVAVRSNRFPASCFVRQCQTRTVSEPLFQRESELLNVMAGYIIFYVPVVHALASWALYHSCYRLKCNSIGEREPRTNE